jgi:hypothetical protein
MKGIAMRFAPPFAAVLVVSLCCGLTACDPDAPPKQQASVPVASAVRAQTPDREGAVQKHMAVSHGFVLRLPAGDVEQSQRRHIDACVKAGGTILASQLNRADDGRVNASLSLRISPAAFEAFATLLAAPPATIVSHAEITEDKTVAVLDVEKRLEIKRALRDRLQAMLKDPGKANVADLVAIEKELAQVQGEIESAVAQQEYLRTLTETIKVDVTYQGVVVAAAGVDLSPITNALHNVGRTLVTSVGALISFLAMVLPWLPMVALALWAVARSWRKWRRFGRTATDGREQR